MDWYLSQVAKLYLPAFWNRLLFRQPDAGGQLYDGSAYVKGYTYLGIAGKQNEEGLYHLEQKNKFSVGETIEIMKPDGRNIPVTVESIRSLEGEEMDSAPHARQQLLVGLGGLADEYDILRRREEGRENKKEEKHF